MIPSSEKFKNSNIRHLGVCFLSPAFLPDWFWQPTADRLRQRGFDCRIPTLQRGANSTGIEANIDAIEATMEDCDLLYLVGSSRGVEYEERYVDRLGKRGMLSRLLGRSIYNSVGPRGLDATDDNGQVIPRRMPDQTDGRSLTEAGLEVMDPEFARTILLRGLRNQRMRARVLKQLVAERPLSATEIAQVPHLGQKIAPVVWYQGSEDLIDNPAAAEAVPQQQYGVVPRMKNWGHVGPLSHVREVADTLITDIYAALKVRKANFDIGYAQKLASYPTTDNLDTVAYMKTRRKINENYAEKPVNFNAEGLRRAAQVIGRQLNNKDLVADVGSSTGEMIAEAAIYTGFEGQIVAIDPDISALTGFMLLPAHLHKRIQFIKSPGECIPVADNTFQGVTLHNVVFRTDNLAAMLHEVAQKTVPGGFVAISTNAEGHALKRHHYEEQTAQAVIAMSGTQFTVPRPPAHGRYLHNIPEYLAAAGNYEVIDELAVTQESRAIITPGERLETYLESLRFSAANTDIPNHLRSLWRFVVNTIIKEQILADMTQTIETYDKAGNKVTVPYFEDPIKRGMIMARVVK